MLLRISVKAEVVAKQPKILENPRGHEIIPPSFLVVYRKVLTDY